MTRYYLIATLIVVALGSIVFARRLAAPDLRISARPTGTPTLERRATPEPGDTIPAFSGQGPWVLSALPACFDEQSRISGPAESLSAKIPASSTRVAAGARIAVKACTIVVRAHDIWVERGSDRLRVPPEAALYRDGARLTLVARTARTIEIRRY